MTKKTIRPTRKHAQGFTIVELMIATMVFSSILVAITVGVMHFTKSYYKAVYDSATQNAARTISESITKAIEFSASSNTVTTVTDKGSYKYFCAGGYVFGYTLGQQYNGTSATKGMYMQPNGGVCDDAHAAPAPGHKQLLGKNMRIVNLGIAPNSSNGSYEVTVTVAYGDDDLLNAGYTSCKAGSGSEYCSVASFTAVVKPRVAT